MRVNSSEEGKLSKPFHPWTLFEICKAGLMHAHCSDHSNQVRTNQMLQDCLHWIMQMNTLQDKAQTNPRHQQSVTKWELRQYLGQCSGVMSIFFKVYCWICLFFEAFKLNNNKCWKINTFSEVTCRIFRAVPTSNQKLLLNLPTNFLTRYI